MNGPAAWLHHCGCLTRTLVETVEAYRPLLGPALSVQPIPIATQKVQVGFIPLGNDTFLELVQPNPDNRFLNRLLDKGVSFYHLGFLCSDLKAKEEELLRLGAKVLARFESEAFEGRECVFLWLPNEQMVELIQAP